MSAAAAAVLMPQHYALSEALGAAAGAYAIMRAARINPWFALGLAPVALAALVGAIRIAGELTGPIVDLHMSLSRPGALFGFGCMVGALLGRSVWLAPVLGVSAAAISIVAPATNPPIFVVLTLAGAVLAYRASTQRKALAAGSFAFLMIAILICAPFGKAYPAITFHAFHVLVAVWFVLVVAFVPMGGPRKST